MLEPLKNFVKADLITMLKARDINATMRELKDELIAKLRNS